MRSRPPIEQLLDAVEWVELPEQRELVHGDLPFATHGGVFKIGDAELRCYQLSDGRRIFDADDVARFFGADDT